MIDREPFDLNRSNIARDSASIEWTIYEYILENVDDEETLLDALGTMKQYFSRKESFCTFPLSSIEILAHVLDRTLKTSRSTDAKIACIEIFKLIMSSDCNAVLKNRLMVAGEQELICLFIQKSVFQAIIWDCFLLHLMSTSKIAPIIRLLLSCAFTASWSRPKRDLCIGKLFAILKDIKEAKISNEDLAVVFMFILEKLLKSDQNTEDIGHRILALLMDCISPEEFNISVQLLPNHLQSVFSGRIKRIRNGMRFLGKPKTLPDSLLYEPNNNDGIIPFTGHSNHIADIMDRIDLQHCLEFANSLKKFLSVHLIGPNTVNRLRSVRELEATFSNVMGKVDILTNKRHMPLTITLLDVTQVILSNVSPGTVATNLCQIVKAMAAPLADENEAIRKKLSEIFTTLCYLVPPGSVVEQLKRQTQSHTIPKIRCGLLRAIIFTLLLYPSEKLDSVGLCRDLSPLLCVEDAEIRQITLGCFALLADAFEASSDCTEETCKIVLDIVTGELRHHMDSVKLQILSKQLKSSVSSSSRPFIDQNGLVQYQGIFLPNDIALSPVFPNERVGWIEPERKTDQSTAIVRLGSPQKKIWRSQDSNGFNSGYAGDMFGNKRKRSPTPTLPKLQFPEIGRRKRYKKPLKTSVPVNPPRFSYAELEKQKRQMHQMPSMNQIRNQYKSKRTCLIDSKQLAGMQHYEQMRKMPGRFHKQNDQADELRSVGSSQLNRESPLAFCRFPKVANVSHGRTSRHHVNDIYNLTKQNNMNFSKSSTARCSPSQRCPSAPFNIENHNLLRERTKVLKTANIRRQFTARKYPVGSSLSPECRINYKTEGNSIPTSEKSYPKLRPIHRPPKFVERLSSSGKKNRGKTDKSYGSSSRINSAENSISRMTSAMEVGEWDDQLEALETFKCLIQTCDHEEIGRLLKNDVLLQRLVRGLTRAVLNLRSQVSKCAMNSVYLFGEYLLLSRNGDILDPHAGRLVQALLRRIGGDKSTKFLHNESFAALSSISKCLNPMSTINLLCTLVLEHEAKSVQTRVAIAKIVYNLIKEVQLSNENTQQFSRQSNEDGLERLIKVATILTEDRSSEARYFGREIFKRLSQLTNIAKICRQKMSDRTWRAVQHILQECSERSSAKISER